MAKWLHGCGPKVGMVMWSLPLALSQELLSGEGTRDSVCGDPSSKNGWANLCCYCWQRRAHSAVLCAIDGCGKVVASLGANSVYGVVVDATSTFPAYNKTCCQARAFVAACVGICRRKIDGQMCVFTAGSGGLT